MSQRNQRMAGWTAGIALSLLPGCSGWQSALAPAGPNASRLAELWWGMLAVAALVTAVVVVVLLVGVLRSAGNREERPLNVRQSRNLVIAGGIILPLAAIVPFVLASFSIGRTVDGPAPEGALTVEVVGRLWWWEVHYQNDAGQRIVTTANEIHIPVGRPVKLLLTSDNVIHSFWVPNLQGKKDMIPGHVNTAWLQAEQAGVYRGQCAEFCGTQHALMAFLVVAESPQQFERWLARQQRPAAEPSTPDQIRGRDVFMNSRCMECHTIRGTAARGTVGPDLTHIGSRRMLAAATMPNSIGHLGGWIADPQHAKPGNQMPAVELTPEQLKALISYLTSLQ